MKDNYGALIEELKYNYEALIEKLIDDNDHTAALIVKALQRYRYDLVERLAKIAHEQEELGSMTLEMIETRRKIEGELK